MSQGRGANLFSVTVMRKYEQNVKFTFLHGIKLKLILRITVTGSRCERNTSPPEI